MGHAEQNSGVVAKLVISHERQQKNSDKTSNPELALADAASDGPVGLHTWEHHGNQKDEKTSFYKDLNTLLTNNENPVEVKD